MLTGVFMEAVVAEQLGFQPWLPEGIELTDVERKQYFIQARRVSTYLNGPGRFTMDSALVYQPPLSWPWAKGRWVDGHEIEAPEAEGHPDFGLIGDSHLIDLKTTEYPTEEWVDKYLHSVQMCAYMAAFQRMYERPCKLTIILASRLEEPDPVKFNKDGTVSLSGQNADHHSLMEAVRLMGDKADDRHHAMAFKAPVWEPMIVKSLEPEQCAELAKVGSIFLDAGIAILNTGLADIVVRPYS
jgi:hypothetical protein